MCCTLKYYFADFSDHALPYWNFISIIQVHENGLIFFDGLTGVTAPQSINSIPFGSASFVAPYWVDNDPSSGGIISFEVHTGSSPLLRQVSQHVSNYRGSQFCGTWMLVADWFAVPVRGDSEVGSMNYDGLFCPHHTLK